MFLSAMISNACIIPSWRSFKPCNYFEFFWSFNCVYSRKNGLCLQVLYIQLVVLVHAVVFVVILDEDEWEWFFLFILVMMVAINVVSDICSDERECDKYLMINGMMMNVMMNVDVIWVIWLQMLIQIGNMVRYVEVIMDDPTTWWSNAHVFTEIHDFTQFRLTANNIKKFQGQKCLAEGKGLVIIKLPDSDMIIPLLPSYYYPTAPNNIIGLSPIKEWTKFRSVRLEALDWIRFVDRNGKTVRLPTNK